MAKKSGGKPRSKKKTVRKPLYKEEASYYGGTKVTHGDQLTEGSHAESSHGLMNSLGSRPEGTYGFMSSRGGRTKGTKGAKDSLIERSSGYAASRGIRH